MQVYKNVKLTVVSTWKKKWNIRIEKVKVLKVCKG